MLSVLDHCVQKGLDILQQAFPIHRGSGKNSLYRRRGSTQSEATLPPPTSYILRLMALYIELLQIIVPLLMISGMRILTKALLQVILGCGGRVL